MPDILLIGQANVSAGFLPKIQAEVAAIRSIIADKATKYLDPRELTFTAKSLSEEFNNPLFSSNIKFLHYAGHSSQKGISFQENGETKLMLKENLVAFLKNQQLRFVFLNSCLSDSIAQDLHAAGVPIVIGTTDKVGDEDAVKIAKQFYSTLAGMPGRTLLQAFEDTTTFFRNNPAELQQNYVFRGLGSDEDTSQDFAWNIYGENAPEAVKNWCLIPAKNYLLSNAQNDPRKKVFCLYGKAQKEYYELLARHANHSKLQILISSIWKISEDVTSDDFVVEWNAANTIVHFLNEDYPHDLEALYQGAVNHLLNKNHLFINVDKSQTQAVAFLNKYNIVPSLLLPSPQNPSAMFTGENTIRDILQKALHLTTLLEKFEKILLPDLANFFSISADQLSKDLEDLDFENEKKPYSAGIPKLFFTLIEGSPDCAQALLVKTIKKRMGISSNVKIEVLKIGQNPSINNSFTFGFALMQLLQVVPNADMMKTCANAILDKKEDFVLVFDYVNNATLDLYQQTIIDQLWDEMIKSYQKRVTKDNFTLNYSLMIFALNYEPVSLPVPTPSTHPFIQIEKISPVSLLSENEYNGWYFSKEAIYKGFKELTTNKHKIVGNQRKVAMIEICKSLNCDHSVIVTKALELS